MPPERNVRRSCSPARQRTAPIHSCNCLAHFIADFCAGICRGRSSDRRVGARAPLVFSHPAVARPGIRPIRFAAGDLAARRFSLRFLQRGAIARPARSAPAPSPLRRLLHRRVWVPGGAATGDGGAPGSAGTRQSAAPPSPRPDFPAYAPCAPRTSRQRRSSCLRPARSLDTCRRIGPLCSRGGRGLVHGGHRVNTRWYFIDADDRQRVFVWIVARPQHEPAGDHPERQQ